jgi:Xaa-Pro aminopeptidase
MGLKTHGTMAVDWENRIDFDRLRRERLQKAKDLLAKSSMGSLLCFDMNNVRYLTATHIGTWAQDKANRFTLLPQNDDPILWDFGSAAKHHQLNCPWLGPERSRPGISMLRGAMTPEMGRAEDVAKKIRIELEMRGLHKEPVGIDIIELPVLFALQREGLEVVDGQELMSECRVIKTQDEISLLNTSAMMVDAAYDELYRAMKPGLRENEAVGLVSKVLYDLGSEYVEAVNAISGERCNPHPHVFSDRVRPGRTTAEIAAVWPKAQEFGFANEEAAFALQYGHGIGLAIWEKPVISRLVSFEHPLEIKPGMVFALETFWPSTDGWSAARIEEEIVVTATGHEVITRFPAEQLLVAGAHYYTVNGPLPTTRESEASPSERVLEMIETSAKTERVGVSG